MLSFENLFSAQKFCTSSFAPVLNFGNFKHKELKRTFFEKTKTRLTTIDISHQ